MRGRHVVVAAGAVLVVMGFGGLVASAADTDPAVWFIWFAGAAVAHDLVLTPLVLGMALLTGRVPGAYRRPARTALVLAGSVTLVALPMVFGFGRRPDNPSVLPQAYGAHLATVVIVIALVTAAVAVLNAYSHLMGRKILTILGVLLAIWLLITVIGMVIAALKFLIWIGLFAVVAAVVVTMVSRMSKNK